jgi:hypothetical protein
MNKDNSNSLLAAEKILLGITLLIIHYKANKNRIFVK